MNTSIIISLIGVIISAISVCAVIYFNSKNSKHTDTKDTQEQMRERIEEIKERTKENAVINAKLDNINSSNMQINERVSSLMEKVDVHGNRITIVEESCKSAHHRIDGLEQRMNKEDNDND